MIEDRVGNLELLKRHFFADRLVEWFRASHRDLPWRRTKEPYHIWVSEIMLQQTRVDTVIPYYERFMTYFPTIEALADAAEDEVLKAWEGLGYYSRVRNLQAAARTIQHEWGGVVPNTRAEISQLKGVGPYTAGAILSIAYDLPEPAVDGNVLRVLSRFMALYDDIAKPATRVKMETMLYDIIPEDAAGDFNQALMELGATVCTPRSAKCGLCPVSAHCAALASGLVDDLPIKTKAKPPRREERAAFIVRGSGSRKGQVLLRRRPAQGLLAQMWELPNEELPFEAQEQFGLSARHFIDIDHVFSHIIWDMKVYVCDEREAEELLGLASPVQGDLLAVAEETAAYDGGNDASSTEIWVSRDTWQEVTLPNVFIRILRHYFAE